MPIHIDHTGETNLANNGQKMTIISCPTSQDITIQFEDGTIVTHKSYHEFKSGKIKNPNIPKSLTHKQSIIRTGETRKSNNGQMMTIIKYRNTKDIDIQFEDGTVLTHKNYQEFKHGRIGNPNLNFRGNKKSNRIGQTNVASNGQIITIIDYQNSRKLTVQFEDGTIIANKSYQNFLNGTIRNPNAPNHKPGQLKSKKVLAKMQKQYIGLTKMDGDGQPMQIIDYIDNNHIRIRFADGIEADTNMQSFKRGTITSKTYNAAYHYVGQTNTAHNGHTMTIIDYQNSAHVTVQFDNGMTNTTTLAEFRSGMVRMPKPNEAYVGETVTGKSGQRITITHVNNKRDITVQFQNGDVRQHCSYYAFKAGNIAPLSHKINHITYEHRKPIIIQGQKHFKCQCKKCGFEDYMTVDQMLAHKCNEATLFEDNVLKMTP